MLSQVIRTFASFVLLAAGAAALGQQPAPLDEALLEAQAAAFKAEHRAAMFDKLRDNARKDGGWVRVIVEIDVPAFATLRADSVAAAPGDNTPDDELAAAIGAAADRELARLAILPHRVNRVFKTAPGMALTVSERALTALEASPGVIWVSEDPLVEPFLDESTVVIGAVEAWSMSLTGTGWWIAVLDTGLLASHRMFAGKPVVQACFSHKAGWNGDPNDPNGDCPNGLAVDHSANSAQPFEPNYFGYDHGTHVAGIAVGKDTLTPRYGVARDSGLIAVQVFHRVTVPSPRLLAHSSDVIAGMEHVYSLRNSLQIAAVNLSLGFTAFGDGQQAECDAFVPAMKTVIDNLRAANIATVAASGNFLPVPCYLNAWPACISSAVSVTAIDANGRFADFAMHNFMTDLSAPGVAIKSATASGDDQRRRRVPREGRDLDGGTAHRRIVGADALRAFQPQRDAGAERAPFHRESDELVQPLRRVLSVHLLAAPRSGRALGRRRRLGAPRLQRTRRRLVRSPLAHARRRRPGCPAGKHHLHQGRQRHRADHDHEADDAPAVRRPGEDFGAVTCAPVLPLAKERP